MSSFKHFSFCLVLFASAWAIVMAVPQWRIGTDNRQYLVDPDLKFTWFQAQHECARRNLKLVEIESIEKNIIVLALLKSYLGNSHDFWLGANDEFREAIKRPFYWSSSGKSIVYSYWAPNQPDNAVEHCLHTWSQVPNFQWNDNVCTVRMGLLCEQKPKC